MVHSMAVGDSLPALGSAAGAIIVTADFVVSDAAIEVQLLLVVLILVSLQSTAFRLQL